MNAFRPSLDVSSWPRVSVEPGSRDASSWPVVGEEIRGQREKHWVRAPDATVWLRKRHRPARPFEPAIEVLALELARACYIEAAQATLATWTDAGGAPARGICVLRFLQQNDELVAGYELLCAVDRAYDPERREAHTLERVVHALRHHEGLTDHPLVEPFSRMLMFDAWIGNTDRHPGNWSLVRRDGSLRFAPMYDPAGSLGAELQPDASLLLPSQSPSESERHEVAHARYIARCPSGFGDGAKLVPLEAVVSAAAAARLLSASLLPTFETALRERVPELLRTFADDALPAVRKRFIVDILTRRLAWLKGMG
ncbi:MAG: HipA domain-containing protein [Deltaproteobacteria bacterium]|nr:HipA domain-containing protein [Deltaproteobacteria bacterium]